MSLAAQQFRHILRGLARTPLFTSVVILTLALGIGATTAVFSVVYGVLLKPLPFSEPDGLVGVWHTAPGLGWDRVNQSPALYFTYREEGKSFSDSGMWDNDQVTVTGLAEPEEVPAIRVTDGTLPLLGVQPLFGRLFTAEDDSPGTAETVILAHRFWEERFGGDRNVLGRTLLVDGTPREIIAVMRPDLHFLDYDPDLYLPFRFDRAEIFFGNFSYQGVARLAPGASIDTANAELARLIPLAMDRFPLPEGFTRGMLEQTGFGPRIRPLKEDAVGDVGRTLWLLLATVGLVLLVACANVANLLLVRAESRQRELAIRSALGAGRGRIRRTLLLEAGVLGLTGGLAGLGLAYAGLRLLTALAPQGLPRLDEIAIDPWVLLFTLAVSMLAALVFGTLPMLRLSTGDLAVALREGGRGGSEGKRRGRARDTLVTAQIATALVLLISSGLMIRSFRAMQEVSPGFTEPETVQTLRLSISTAEAATPEEVAGIFQAILEKVAALPGVTSAGLGSSVTMDGWDSNDPIFVEDFPTPADQMPQLRRFKWISPGYFETLGNPLLAGRPLSWDDIHNRRPVAVITENLAREYWSRPGDAVGRRIRINPASPWREIVGIVGNVLDDGVAQPPTAVVYWPMVIDNFWTEDTFTPRSQALAVRSERVGKPGLLDEIRAAVWSVSSNVPLANVRTLEALLERSMARTSFTLTMLLIAAGAALALGAIGIYGVTSYAVTQRTREIGVRMALGARRRDVRRLVLGHGTALAVLGVGLGLAIAAVASRLLAALLFGVSPLDPITYAAGGFGVTLLALAASWFPARRAAGVDPIETLRWE